MIVTTTKKERTRKRHKRTRIKVFGTGQRPRLVLYKSNKHLYAQIINDAEACTLVSCSTLQKGIKKEVQKTWTKEASKKIGEMIARNAIDKGIKEVVFDRGGNKYHGKVLAFAESVRKGGLKF